jgi:hypothetical protein
MLLTASDGQASSCCGSSTGATGHWPITAPIVHGSGQAGSGGQAGRCQVHPAELVDGSCCNRVSRLHDVALRCAGMTTRLLPGTTLPSHKQAMTGPGR